jgi:hypothetical protein
MIGLQGHLRIYRGDELVVDKQNKIVSGGLSVIALMWGGLQAGQTYDNLVPWWIALGDPAGPTAPVAGDTNLEQFSYARHWDKVTFISSGSITNGVEFEAKVPEADANGTVFTEAGLFSMNNDGSGTLPATAPGGGLLARQIFSAITKQPTFSLTIRWEFTFVEL